MQRHDRKTERSRTGGKFIIQQRKERLVTNTLKSHQSQVKRLDGKKHIFKLLFFFSFLCLNISFSK